MTEPAFHDSATAAARAAAAGEQPDAGHVATARAGLAEPAMTPVPVRAEHADDGIYRTTVLQPGQARQLLPQDPGRRYRAQVIPVDAPVILCDSKDQASSPDNQFTATPQTVAAQGATASDPTTGTAVATIAAASLPAGTYSVTVQTYLDGTTPAASDDDNMGLHVGTTSVTHLNIPGIADNVVTSGPYLLTVNGAQSITVVVVTTVTSGAVYHAAITATPQYDVGPGYPQGLLLPVNVRIEVENSGLCWIVNPSQAAAVRVAVLTERYENAQPHSDG